MRKTLVTLALVAVSSVAANAASYMFENTSTKLGYGVIGGWIQALNSTNVHKSDEVPSDTTLYLTAVQVHSYSSTGGADSVKLAVFSDSSSQTYGKLLGLSDVATNPRVNGEIVTFTFGDDIEWTMSGNSYAAYKFVFVSADATEEDVLGLQDKVWNNSVNTGFRVQIDQTTPENGSGILKGDAMGWGTAGYGAYANYVMSDVAPSAPEPATASLSLLGLAALMMRRRRA